MSDRFQTEPFHSLPAIVKNQPTLPAWLAQRLLRLGEHITWVRGPRSSPSWEPLVTDPVLFVYALPFAAGCLAAGVLIAGSWAALSPAAALAALALLLGPIFILGIASGHFTRLVVTNQRLFIVQGRELCNAWNLDELPSHLVRHTRREDGQHTRSVDVDAVTAMLSDLSGKFTEAKSIVEFGKKLDQITLRDNRKP